MGRSSAERITLAIWTDFPFRPPATFPRKREKGIIRVFSKISPRGKTGEYSRFKQERDKAASRRQDRIVRRRFPIKIARRFL